MGNEGIKTFEYFILEAGLYEEIDLTENIGLMEQVLFNKKAPNTIDGYCPECKKDAVFNLESISSVNYFQHSDNDTFNLNRTHDFEYAIRFLRDKVFCSLSYNCSRNKKHLILVVYKIKHSLIYKIGQFPSVAALSLDSATKYEKLLKSDFKDFNKAIGLFSHGVGIGSYVYLRRIFENTLLETFKENKDKIAVDIHSLRMDEKIDALKDFLPSEIAGNKLLYKILSKGIHSLSEDECLKYFPVLRTAIEIILNDKLKKKEEKAKLKELNSQLNKIAEEVK